MQSLISSIDNKSIKLWTHSYGRLTVIDCKYFEQFLLEALVLQDSLILNTFSHIYMADVKGILVNREVTYARVFRHVL